jgi:hypothetical protein
MAERPKHWVKLWVSWLTSPAHLELSGAALGLGPLLLLLATWDGEYESGGWLLGADGKPYDRKALARATHRRDRKELDAQLTELVRCGTLTIRSDGALGFAGFGRWQETKDAKRMRVKRANDEPNGTANSSSQSSRDVQPRRETVDADGEFSLRSNTPTPRSGKRSKPELNPDDIAVLDALDEARVRQGLDPMSAEARTTGTIAKRRKLGATQPQLLEQVAVFERLAERDPSKRTLLCATTPFTAPGAGGGKGGWQWGRDMLDEERVLEVRAKRVTRQRGPAEPSPRPESSGEVDLGEIGGAT